MEGRFEDKQPEEGAIGREVRLQKSWDPLPAMRVCRPQHNSSLFTSDMQLFHIHLA
jgi:hypothetical protein